MSKLRSLSAALGVLMVLGMVSNANAVLLRYTGTVDCQGDPLCLSFGADMGTLQIDSDIVDPGNGNTVTNTADVANVVIAVLLQGGGVLEFVNGGANDVNLTFQNMLPVAGTVDFFATGATTMLPAEALVDVDAGTAIPIVSGNQVGIVTGGSFSIVPVPAAVWLFGSALGLLGWVRRYSS